MPDQIDLSKMQSVVVTGPNGYPRLHRHWREPTQHLWDVIWGNTPSKDYWRDALQGKLLPSYKGLFFRYLPSGAKVLEAGCGVGQIVLALRAHGFDCYGLDYAPDTVKMLKEQFPDVPFNEGDIRNLPYSDSYFDAYISLGVIEHFPDGQDVMLREAARVVKPGGWIFLSVPALNGWRALKSRRGLYHAKATEPFFEACYSVKELEELLRHAGFSPVTTVFQNTVMTFAQETPIRPLYRFIEDRRYLRGIVDRCLRLVLPPSLFGHMVMIVARRNR